MTSALQSGDLQSAQNSFADLQKLLQSSGAIGAASSAGTNPVLSDFQALGQDLTSGNLTGAQKDFVQLNLGRMRLNKSRLRPQQGKSLGITIIITTVPRHRHRQWQPTRPPTPPRNPADPSPGLGSRPVNLSTWLLDVLLTVESRNRQP